MNILLQCVHPHFGVYINEYWTIFQDFKKKIFSFCRSTEEWTAKNRRQYRNGRKYRKCYDRYNDQIRVLVEKFRQSDYKLEEILKGLATNEYYRWKCCRPWITIWSYHPNNDCNFLRYSSCAFSQNFQIKKKCKL